MVNRSRVVSKKFLSNCVALAVVASLGTAALAASGGVSRDWKAFPAVVVRDAVSTTYAIGDIHGDYEKAVGLLTAAGLVKGLANAEPKTLTWAGGTSVLVCTGDMIDKGPRSLDVLTTMRTLQPLAKAAGGEVIVTMGNHEMEFLAGGGTNAKAKDFIDSLKAARLDPVQVANGTDPEGVGAWMRELPVGAKVGDCFFCHAGNTQGRTVGEIESAVESGVAREGFGTRVLMEGNSILEARMHPVPWWADSMVGAESKKKAKEAIKEGESGWEARVAGYVKALGCHHLVVGHQPGEVDFGNGVKREADKVFSWDGLMFLIDTGMSKQIDDGEGTLLKITVAAKKGKAEWVTVKGVVEAWKE